MSLEKLLTDLAGTAELMGKQLSPVALAMMVNDLKEYPIGLINTALSNVRKGTKPFSLGSIISEIETLKPDGRLGADEAWALYPHDEATTAVITNEIAEAMQIAYPILQEGDKVGARMAFKEAYTRIVTKNKADGLKPKWFPSIGTDKEGREHILKQSVQLGRLTQDHATSLLPAPIHSSIANAISEVKFLTSKDIEFTDEQKAKARDRVAEIKAMLAKG
jgi:hypothetical protein